MDSTLSSTVTDRKLSTVVPANVTGDLVHELTGVDLAMKLHYLRSVYYFKPSETIESLGIVELKAPMFPMLDINYPAAGRIRRDESGKPHIKCNDGGVRIIEAKCDLTMDEWLAVKCTDRYKHLVHDTVLGPDLFFSPPVLIQFTWFKCGGMSIGMSWAHVLGDAVSASNTIKLWSHFLVNKQPLPKTKHFQNANNKITSHATEKPLSIKQVESVGDTWLASTDHKMASFSFQITESKLKSLQSKVSGEIPTFEAISAVIWQSLAKVRKEKEPDVVTIIRNDPRKERKHNLGNNQTIVTVSTNSSIGKLELSELATMMSNKGKDDEMKEIEEVVERESGKEDYIVYGANLTFVDMEGVELYGLLLKGQKPAYVDYSIDGVGDKGAILVFQGPCEARVVTVVLPEEEIVKLREELESKWSIS